jgi:hypothetical protein
MPSIVSDPRGIMSYFTMCGKRESTVKKKKKIDRLMKTEHQEAKWAHTDPVYTVLFLQLYR